MAVEARRLNLFPPQLMPNREISSNPIDPSFFNLYNNHTGNNFNYSSVLPLSGTTTTTASETLLPPALPYNSTTMKSDVSTLSYATSNNNDLLPVQRKRSRDSMDSYSYPSQRNCGAFSFLGEDISLQIHHQELQLDNLITQHMEKVRMELEEKRKTQARRLMEAIEIGMMKRLKAKEEEMEKIGRLNVALEERVKSLCMENQIWRELAQTNEATANALRTNLEQVLAQARDDAVVDDAESCCGSTDEDCDRGAQDKDEEQGSRAMMNSCDSDRRKLCRNCGKEESCVLILPCRHLCLCTVCGSTLHTCPICNSIKNASLLVNLT